jgi:hypothetical protein
MINERSDFHFHIFKRIFPLPQLICEFFDIIRNRNVEIVRQRYLNPNQNIQKLNHKLSNFIDFQTQMQKFSTTKISFRSKYKFSKIPYKDRSPGRQSLVAALLDNQQSCTRVCYIFVALARESYSQKYVFYPFFPKVLSHFPNTSIIADVIF